MKVFKLFGWLIITLFVTLHIGLFSSAGAVYLMEQLGIIQHTQPIPWMTLFGTIMSSFSIAIVLTAIVTRKLFAPLRLLTQSMEQVASGDFSVRLPEDNPGLWMHDVNINFNKMVTELNSTELLQSDFVQSVSHEFKTPLAAMDGYASLLLCTSLTAEQKQYAERISKSCRQLSILTGNILMLSKLENAEIVSKKELFPLDEQIRQVVLSMETLWSARSLNMDLILPETPYYGNKDLIIQIWVNLLSNAIKFTQPGGVISIWMIDGKDDIRIVFRDTGIGMTEEVQSRIFEKFFQAESSRNIQGNGLGLALVKKIVTLCNGEIFVESKPDLGSSFTVILPKEYH
ncbi:MAG: HAMP domain-containing histidine kinase [Clostridiales bacterium]|nr:HAMP domain-containing histidine kinase [Clostridiales bacterium]